MSKSQFAQFVCLYCHILQRSEIWTVKKDDVLRLEINNARAFKLMFDIKPEGKISNKAVKLGCLKR